jgi:hypothetical protein
MTNTFHRNDATFSQVGYSDLSGTLPSSTVTISSTQITATAWTTYNPNITASSGSFTTVSGAGWYQQIGKTVAINIKVTVTTSGTASNGLSVDLPVSGLVPSMLLGREIAINGAALTGTISSSSVFILKYDNTTPPTSSGSVLIVSGVYQSV